MFVRSILTISCVLLPSLCIFLFNPTLLHSQSFDKNNTQQVQLNNSEPQTIVLVTQEMINQVRDEYARRNPGPPLSSHQPSIEDYIEAVLCNDYESLNQYLNINGQFMIHTLLDRSCIELLHLIVFQGALESLQALYNFAQTHPNRVERIDTIQAIHNHFNLNTRLSPIRLENPLELAQRLVDEDPNNENRVHILELILQKGVIISHYVRRTPNNLNIQNWLEALQVHNRENNNNNNNNNSFEGTNIVINSYRVI